MRKILAILIFVCLLTFSYNGLNTKSMVNEKNIDTDEETLKIITLGENTSNIIFFNGREYYLPAFPDKTQEQLNKMIKNPQPTMSVDDLPDSFSWTNYNGGDYSTPAKDQENCGSFWAFGALGAMEAAINIAKGDPNFDRDLSEQYLLSCLPAAGSCSGGWMSEAIQYIKDTGPNGNNINGCTLELCMPYQAVDYIPCDEKCDNWDYYTIPPQENNVLFQVLDYGVTSLTPSNPSDWDILKTWIITYGPLSVDIVASNGWSSYWSSHHSSTDWYYETGSGYTNHAQVCYGWVDDDSVTHGGYWILKNSWGTGWGYGGFNNLAYGGLLLGDRDVTWVTTPTWPTNNPPNTPTYLYPSNHDTDIDVNGSLLWSCSDPDGDNLTYDVYFGIKSNPPLASKDKTQNYYNPPGEMSFNTTYYWRIVAEDEFGAKTEGSVWDFITSSEPNHPPYMPNNLYPENDAINIPTNIVLTWTGGDPDIGDTVTYDVYFSNFSIPPSIQKIASNISNTSINPGILAYGLTYYWGIIAWDDHNSSTVGGLWHFTTINPNNKPPNKPNKPSGQTKGKIGQNYIYITNTTDPEGEQLYYNWSWGDGTYSGWIGPNNHGEIVNESHSWTDKGNYEIKVKAKDIFDAESDWSDPLTIRMPKNKGIYIPLFLQRFFQRFPFFEKILNLN